MTQDTVKALSDGELEQVIAWAQDKQKMRVELQKQETIAKIKALASSVGLEIRIKDKQVRTKPSAKARKHNNTLAH